MKIEAISLLLVGCCFALVTCTGNDFKIAKDDDGVEPRIAADDPEQTTPASGGVELNWCKKSDGNCTKNMCEQNGKVCCFCDTYINSDSFGPIQPCFCCPKDHVCCSSSKPLGLNNSTSNCCPSNTECSPDGNSCVQKIKPVAAEALIQVCHDSVVNTGAKNNGSSFPSPGW